MFQTGIYKFQQDQKKNESIKKLPDGDGNAQFVFKLFRPAKGAEIYDKQSGQRRYPPAKGRQVIKRDKT